MYKLANFGLTTGPWVNLSHDYPLNHFKITDLVFINFEKDIAPKPYHVLQLRDQSTHLPLYPLKRDFYLFFTQLYYATLPVSSTGLSDWIRYAIGLLTGTDFSNMNNIIFYFHTIFDSIILEKYMHLGTFFDHNPNNSYNQTFTLENTAQEILFHHGQEHLPMAVQNILNKKPS